MNNFVDNFLFNASESQLRNVLAIVSRSRSITDEELVAAIQREAKTAAKEQAESIDEDDVTFGDADRN